jgi:hypothetical protein
MRQITTPPNSTFWFDWLSALAGNTVSIVPCPVDYSENIKLTDELGEFEFVL